MSKAVIAGGGLIGMLTAWELVNAGWQVILLDRGRIGRESSWAGGGILSPLYPWRYADPITELARWSQSRYPALVEVLHERSGIDPEWTLSGLLMLDTSDQESAMEWAERFNYELETLSGKELHYCEPALSPTVDSALWMKSVAQVRNPLLVRSLHHSLMRRGVEIREECEASHLLTHNGDVAGVVTSGGRIQADVVIIAAGAWSGNLLAKMGMATGGLYDIRPVRGQMLLFKVQPGMIRRIILGQRHYIIPRRDGRVLVGSTMEEAGFDKRVTSEAREELLEAAHCLVPALAEVPVERHWAGLRPGSPIGVPYIGEHPDIRGLFVNSGHFRNGVVMGPASARLLVDLIQDVNPILDPRPYAL